MLWGWLCDKPMSKSYALQIFQIHRQAPQLKSFYVGSHQWSLTFERLNLFDLHETQPLIVNDTESQQECRYYRYCVYWTHGKAKPQMKTWNAKLFRKVCDLFLFNIAELDGEVILRVAIGSAITQLKHVKALWNLIGQEADKILSYNAGGR